MFEHAAAWLLTYALHSTLLLSLAWLASGPLGRRSLRLEEAVWRVALLGALATSTFQVATGWHPAATLRLPAAVARVEAAPATLPESAVPIYKEEAGATPAPVAPAAAFAPPVSSPEVSTPEATPAIPATPATLSPVASPLPAGSRGPLWMRGLTAVWALAAFLLTLRLGLAHLSLRRRLRSRLPVSGGTLARLLDRLAPAAGLARPVRLSCSHELPVPVALGVRRPEIAVPPRALSHLSTGEQESLLAHELGHLVRRDPVWLAGGQLLAGLLFFQPLNWVARRRLRELSELLCDEWAVGRTGQPLSLARCLAEVAQWSLEPARLLPVPGMADRPSNLGRRIHRLLDGEREGALPRWGLAALGALLLSVAVVAPGVSAPPPPTPPVPPVPEVASAPEAPEPPEAAEAPEPPKPPRRAPKARLAKPARPAPLHHHGLTPEERAHLEESARESEEMEGRDRLSEEQMRRIEAETDRMSREIEERLRPQMQQLEKLAAEMEAQRPNDEEMKALEQQIDSATRHLRSPEEEARFEADVRKLAESSATMNPEERKRLTEEIRTRAESMRPSPEELAALRKLGERHREMAHKLTGEQRKQLEAARRDIEKQMVEVRRMIQRQMDRLHQELRAGREKGLGPLPRPHLAPGALPVPAPSPRPEAAPRPAPAPRAPRTPRPPQAALPAPPAPPAPPGVGIPGGIEGGVEGGVKGGVQGGVEGGIPGGVEGGVEGAVPPPPPPPPPARSPR